MQCLKWGMFLEPRETFVPVWKTVLTVMKRYVLLVIQDPYTPGNLGKTRIGVGNAGDVQMEP